MFDAFSTFIRQTADTIHHAIDNHAGRIEIRVLGTVERIVNARFNRLEAAMTAQSDAFTAALSGLMGRVADLRAGRDAAVESARAAQEAKDQAAIQKAEAATDEAHAAADAAVAAADAQVKDATDKLIALTVGLTDHVEAVAQVASAATAPTTIGAPPAGTIISVNGDPYGTQAPVQAVDPDPAPVVAPEATAPASEPVPEPVVPDQPAPTDPVAEPVPVVGATASTDPVADDAPKPFTAESENAEDRAAVAPASTVVP